MSAAWGTGLPSADSLAWLASPPAVPAAAPGWGVWFWVIVVLLVLVILALVGYLFWRHKHPISAGPDEEKKASAKGAKDEDGKAAGAELSQSFQGALATQRSLVEGRDYRYRLPWFLLLGAPGSGKSSLLTESSLTSAIEERAGVEPAAGMAWNFFGTDAVMVDAGGWAVEEGQLQTARWKRLLKLFLNARPERPLDGIVLTISTEDLFGAKALLPAQMIERGALIQQRLRTLTQTLGFQLPLYVVLTKSDALEGFRPFAQELEAGELDQIFGWSNPYSDRLQFQPEWVDEAVHSMRVTAERVQGRLFAAHEAGAGRESMFLFPGSLYATLVPLRMLLSRALRGGGDAPAPLLRGIYCAGATEGTRATVREPDLVPVARPGDTKDRYAAVTYEEEPDTSLALTPGMGLAALQTQLGIGFVHDLFFEKIFPERNLARPLQQFFAVRDKVRTYLQIASACLALLLAIGTGVAYRRLAQDSGRLQMLLANITNDLNAPAEYATDPTQVDTRAGANELIGTMASFQSGGFRSVFLPASWFSALPGEIRQTMVQAFRQLVLARFYGGLTARAEWMSDATHIPLRSSDLPLPAAGSPPVTELERTPDYLQMQEFLRRLQSLDQNIALYNRICQPNSTEPLQSIVQLDGYLHNRTETPDITTQGNPYFQQAMDQATYPCFVYTPVLKRAMTGKAEMLITNLDAAWIAHNPVRGATDAVIADMNRLATPGGADANDVNRVSDHLRQAQTVYAAPELRWAGMSPIAIPGNLAGVTSGVVTMSPFFDGEFGTWVTATGDTNLSQLLSALAGAETTLTGPVTDNSSGELALSAGTLEVQAALDALGKTSFVTGAGQPFVALDPAHPASITWDKSSLEAAGALPVAYGKFMADALGKARAPVRVAVGRIAAVAASATVESAILQAEHVGTGSNALADAQSFSDASQPITGLVGALGQYGLTGPMAQLRNVAVKQAAGVLSELNGSLIQTEPYGVSSALFTRWTAGAPSAALFDAPTPDALAAYIAAQTDEVTALNTAAAPAVHFLEANRAYVPANSVALLARWEGIGVALDGFAGKKPGNSVATLDALVSSGVDTVVPTNGCALPKAGSPGRSDYFTLAASNLERNLRLRCLSLLNQDFEAAYGRLADAFNHDLAERFPFGPLTSLPLAEADPAAIASAYQLYDAAADLLHSPRERTAAPVAQMFVTQLAGARPWFASLLSTASTGVVTLDVVPSFRVERAREVDGDQIIDWALQIGDATVHPADPPAKLHWNVGDPVVLSLRWAKNSPLLPVKAYPPDVTAGAMRSDGETVSWRFTDAWALLRFLRSFQREDPAGRAAATPGQEPFLLQFDVPLLPSSSSVGSARQPQAQTAARVFLRVLVSAPGQKDTLPKDLFPEVAPPLMAHPIPTAVQTQTGDRQ